MTALLARFALGVGLVVAATGPVPAFEWTAGSPESQGMSAAKLDALRDGLAKHGTQAVFVARNDVVVCEWYAPGRKPADTHGTASLAKALVGGVPLALAMDDGLIRMDDLASKYVPEWASDPRKGKITVRHLGSHTSGLEDSSVPGVTHPNEPGWKGEFWKRHAPPNDPFTISRDVTPLLFDPGTKAQYSNPGIAMLGYAVTAALKGRPQEDIRSLLRERVMKPIGVPDDEWNVGYGKTYTVAGLPLVGTWGGGNFSPRATARVGRLMLREGDWDGKRLISAASVRATTADAGTPDLWGMGWWTNADGRYPKLPKDAYWGLGAGDQILLVVPSLKLVAVRNGGALGPTDRGRLLFDPLAEAVVGDAVPSAAPVPPSPVITGITWAPPETIRRAAPDSDIWVTTWADDGHLYTGYGDGTGFVPKVSEKLSMGFARIEGGPDDFRGVNLRSPTFEDKGNGPRGRKLSGLLMVDGTFYMWVRNAGNSRLAWSTDRGATWEWGWKFEKGFGCPTLLNFGRNYDGARDGFVYVYSPDRDTAYPPAADRVVMARVPKDRVRARAAYEFFAGTDGGSPKWSPDPSACAGVLTSPGNCYRVTVAYNPGLKRYLMCQAGSGVEKVRHAAVAVYDAPEPWGPWTTAFYAPKWDVPTGDTMHFPTKWISPDGKTLHLIFAGDDSFSVRKATLTTAGW